MENREVQQCTCIKSIKFAHLSNSRLVPFVLFSKREEKRKKERYSNFSPTRSILSFHVQLISGRAFHSLKAETREKESERETSRYLVIDDRKERWHRADTRKSLVPRALSLEWFALQCIFVHQIWKLSRQPMFIPPEYFSSSSNRRHDVRIFFAFSYSISLRNIVPSRTAFDFSASDGSALRRINRWNGMKNWIFSLPEFFPSRIIWVEMR